MTVFIILNNLILIYISCLLLICSRIRNTDDFWTNWSWKCYNLVRHKTYLEAWWLNLMWYLHHQFLMANHKWVLYLVTLANDKEPTKVNLQHHQSFHKHYLLPLYQTPLQGYNLILLLIVKHFSTSLNLSLKNVRWRLSEICYCYFVHVNYLINFINQSMRGYVL